MRWLPASFIAGGYPCLSLNMRDHDLDQPKDFELAHHDLRAGIDFLIERFGKTPAIVGHGYANNKIICYPAQSGDDRIERNVLATLGSVKKYRPDIWDAVLQGAGRIRLSKLLRLSNDLIERLADGTLFINRQLRIANDVHEQNMTDLELDLFLDLSGYARERPTFFRRRLFRISSRTSR